MSLHSVQIKYVYYKAKFVTMATMTTITMKGNWEEDEWVAGEEQKAKEEAVLFIHNHDVKRRYFTHVEHFCFDNFQRWSYFKPCYLAS